MGREDVYAEEGPVQEVTVGEFWIDRHEVTNRQFAHFVKATGHVTVAEKPVDPSVFGIPKAQIPPHMLRPGSAVFTPPNISSERYADWWTYVPGANWRMPRGPKGEPARRDEPAVHLAWPDMKAYADWRGGRLPTEAEWEYAADAREEAGAAQPAGDEANTWQGSFPLHDEATDGYKGVAPVGCFKPNAKGLYDMIGNVWEVTADVFKPFHDRIGHHPRAASASNAADPLQPGMTQRVIKGGSYLCAPNYCRRYRPEARQGQDSGLGSSNVGFRLVYDRPPKNK